MTQTEIDNTVVDVIYDESQIFHILTPNQEGVRGIPIGQFFLRHKISTVKKDLAHLDQTKVEDYITELKREGESGKIIIE